MKNLLKRLVFGSLRLALMVKYRTVKIKSRAKVNIQSKFEGKNVIGESTVFTGSIGFASYIGSNCILRARIGKYTCIGSNVRVIDSTHPSTTFASIHPMFYSIKKQNGYTYVSQEKFQERLHIPGENYSVHIGNDVWIGNNVLIMGGVKVGNGAVIAAGAVVTKDVADYDIVGGVPAKHIRWRFEEKQIKYLQDLQWWNKGEQWIIEHADYFSNVDDLRKITNSEENGN